MTTKPFAIIAGVGPGTVSASSPHLNKHSIPPIKSTMTNRDILYLPKPQGASIARKFAKSYSVVLLARNPANFNSVVDEINSAGGQATGISTDLSDSKSVSSAFEKITQQYNRSPLAAALFNSGGGFVRKPFLELTEEEFASGFDSQGFVFLPFPTHHSLKAALQGYRI
jgi:hypothetical protein